MQLRMAAVASSVDSTEFRTGEIAEEERMRISEDRKRLLLVLEDVIGNECYNAKIQNWGPHGVFEGEGREFRYPVTFIEETKSNVRRRTPIYRLTWQLPATTHLAQISFKLFGLSTR